MIDSRWIFVLAIVTTLFFLAFPDTDLVFAQALYQEQFSQHLFLRWVFGMVSTISTLAIGFFILEIGCFLVTGKNLWIPYYTVIFYLLCWVTGPGLVVNLILKDHVGRPRPSQIIPFKGRNPYVPPFQLSNACKRNCSFVSGHASVGYVFVATAFVYPAYRRRLFCLGFMAGSGIGYIRMLQGGHFLSDVIFSFFATYLGIFCVYHLMVKLGFQVISNASTRTDVMGEGAEYIPEKACAS